MLKAEVTEAIKTNKDLQYALGKLVHKEGSQTIYNWARRKEFEKLMDFRILHFLSLYFETTIEQLLTEEAFKEVDYCKSIMNIA